MCHAAEVRTGGFCLCLLGYNPDFRVVPALLSAVDMPAVYGWVGSQYVCHAAEVRTGGFCLCLLGNIPDIWDVSALLSAVDMTAVFGLKASVCACECPSYVTIPGNLCSPFWGLLCKKGRFETYLPVGTFPRGWYVSLVCHASRVP